MGPGNNDPKTNDLNRQWADLFRMQSLATGVGGLLVDALCFRCKCSHGCRWLVADPQIFGYQFLAARLSSGDFSGAGATRETLEQIDKVHQLLHENGGTTELARSSAEIARITEAGRIVSILGLENIQSIEGSVGVLRMYFELGVRYLTFTRADLSALTGAAGRSGGWLLDVVREANGLGLALHTVDIDRHSVARLREIYSAPIIGSTTAPGCVGCLEDDVMQLLKDTGGIVMTHAFTSHGELEPVKRIAAELARVAGVVGPEHVGLGSSGDGWSAGRHQGMPVYPELRGELSNRGFSRTDIENMLGGNFARTWRSIEDAARP